MSNIDHQLVVMLHACVHSIRKSSLTECGIHAHSQLGVLKSPHAYLHSNCKLSKASEQKLCDFSLQNIPDFAAVHPGSVLASDYGSACQNFVLLHQRMLAWYQLDQRSLQAVLQLKTQSDQVRGDDKQSHACQSHTS